MYAVVSTGPGMRRLLLLFIFLVTICRALGKVTEDNCEVCVKFIKKFLDTAPSDRNQDNIKSALKEYCRGRKGKEYSFCYNVGLLEESAAKTINALVLPITMYKPAEKVCEDLKKIVTDICDLRYEKVLDLKSFDFQKAKVKDLREILRIWDIQCVGCVERSDFYRFVIENLPKFDPEAAAAQEARKKAEL